MTEPQSAYLEVDTVRKSFGDVIAVNDVKLSVARGERLALLGPSGCGKTTTLNIIAGFLSPDSGTIRIGGRDITSQPAHRRNTGMVFQQYALFPHMSVARNIAFGLRMRKVAKAEIAHRVAEVLALVRLEAMSERLPRALSGGQQQRIALARALVIRPDILLLDEPLSNLDAKLRREMRTEMLSLLDSVGLTTILVTHDQDEALALANRIAVMNRGHVEQVGLPVQVFENPATSFVAKFLGDPNILRGRVIDVDGRCVTCDIGAQSILKGRTNMALSKGANVDVLVRSERIQLAESAGKMENSLAVKVEQAVYLGNNIRYSVRAGEHVFALLENNVGQPVRAGGNLVAEWSAKDTLVFPA